MYFVSYEDEWNERFNELIEYININKKTPSSTDENDDVKKLYNWMSNQARNYKNNKMFNSKIFKIWKNFVDSNEYKIYFLSNRDLWCAHFEKLKTYIEIYHKRPSDGSKNNDTKKLGRWTQHQVHNYKNKKSIMKNPDIYKMWTDFITNPKYSKYFS